MHNLRLVCHRRSFLRGGAIVAATAALPFAFAYRRTARAAVREPLVPDPQGIIDLPPGFSYTVVDRKGAPMSDGYRVPGRPDAMGAFPGPGGTIVLMRNHEVGLADPFDGPYAVGAHPPEAYDELGMGGVTRLVLDPDTLEVVTSNLVLTGTVRNCAGGVSPWGWLSCEETTDGIHGYTFICPIDADSVRPPRRIAGYGRFNHEAACVDPDTLIAYLTEDRGDSCLYRFVPHDQTDPFSGTLQALRVKDEPMYATTEMEVGAVVAVEWIDIDEPTPSGDTVRVEAQGKGAAVFVRGEGIWFHDGAVYVCATSGGPVGAGQIFRLVDAPGAASLELLARSEDPEILDKPDNITVAPWGDLFMAEDGDGDNYVRVLTPSGEIRDFARNALSDHEFAGVCFSPDGSVLFVNIQGDGLTLAIRGPFPRVPEEGTTGDDPPAGGTGDSGEDASTAGDASGGSSDPTPAPQTGTTADGSDDETTGSAVDADDAATGCACTAAEDASLAMDITGVAAGALALHIAASRPADS